MRRHRYRVTERTNNADAARDFARSKVEVVFSSRISVSVDIIEGSVNKAQQALLPCSASRSVLSLPFQS